MPVYFMQDEKTYLIKIGKASKNLLLRRRTLEKEFLTRLHILGVVDGEYEKESSLHKKFSHLRSHREWFFPSTDLVEFIDKNTRDPYEYEKKTQYYSFTMKVQKSLIDQAKQKAGYTPLSVVIRRLLDKWIKGEIELDLTKKDA